MTYQDRKFCAGSSKGAETGAAPGSSKTKKTKTTTTTRKESRTALPQPEPLSNILGPNIPALDVGGGGRDTTTSWRAGPAPAAAPAKKAEAPLINLLDDLVGPTAAPANGNRGTANTSSQSLLGDLMSLSVAPAPVSQAANPFGMGMATAAPVAPAVDPQQIAQLQTQVQNMQTAILSAKQQMMTVQEQIQRGQAVVNQLNPQQREQLAALMQRFQAMNTQFTAMNQQYNAAAAKLQQMLAAAAAPPPTTTSSSSNLFANFGVAAPPANNSMGMFGGMGAAPVATPAATSLYATGPSTSSSNLYATAPTYSTPTSTSSTNLFPPATYSTSTTNPPASTNGYSSHSSSDLFASLSAPPTAYTNPNPTGGFGAPSTFQTPS